MKRACSEEVERLKRVAVFGLGYVGLPLALSFAQKGCEVWGVDVSDSLVSELSQGETSLQESRDGVTIQDMLKECVYTHRFHPTTNAQEALSAAQEIVVTVGVSTRDGALDFSAVLRATETIARGCQGDSLVLFRGTVPPGTVEERLVPSICAAGRTLGSDVFVAYAPERIAEGRAFLEFEQMPTIVSAVDEASLSRAISLLKLITEAPLHAASTMRTAEMVKVIENVQRDVNLAISQELARVCERSNLDVFEVVRLANTHQRVSLLQPGPGVGGYCVPNALSYLQPVAREIGVHLDLFELARAINEGVPGVISKMALETLSEAGRTIRGGHAAILGIAMKDFCSDDRHSPAVSVALHLEDAGMLVKAFDPCVPAHHHFQVESVEECLTGADVLLILARQPAYDPLPLDHWLPLMHQPAVIIDTRNCVRDAMLGDHPAIVRRI